MIKEFKSGDGCRFMCTCLPGSTSVFDMDVDDGVEVVEFEGFDDVSIGKVAEKSFPSVKTLVIGEEVECMSIPNEMFPNVRNIISYNRHFLNSDMLIRVDYNMFPDKNGKRTDVWLLNTFCKKPDEVINLKSVEFIDGYAFYGCRSTKIINEDCVKGGFKLAFFGSAFMELEPVGGAYMAGSMIIDVDKDAKELVIPETATYFLHNIHNVTFIRELCKSYDKIIVKNSSLFFKRVLYAYAAPKNLVIDCEVYDDKEDFCNYIKNCSNLQNIQITDKSERYMTYDGVLYDKAGKTLLACPKNRHGTVKIKEGTKEIEKNAFFGSEVEGIEMPDSVKSLEKAVFFNCRKLQKVKLSNSLTEIPNSCFDSNISLREIVIPDSVSTIGPYAFCSSGLENIHLTVLEPLSFVDCKAKEIIMPDSVETIKHCAFKNCDNLKKIVFGKGIKVIDRDAFHGCHTVNEIVFPEDAVLVQEVKAYENVDAYRKRKKCDESIIDSVENLVSSIFNTTTYAGLPSEEDTRKLVHHFLETGDVACTVKITIGERAVVRQKYINHLDLPSMVSIVRGWMAGWQLITTMSSNLYYSLGIVIESFLTTRSEENTSDRLCLSNLNIFDTVSNIFGSEATAKLIAEDVFCDKQMQDALQFFVENRMTIEASALLQKMKEKGIKPYDENFKL